MFRLSDDMFLRMYTHLTTTQLVIQRALTASCVLTVALRSDPRFVGEARCILQIWVSATVTVLGLAWSKLLGKSPPAHPPVPGRTAATMVRRVSRDSYIVPSPFVSTVSLSKVVGVFIRAILIAWEWCNKRGNRSGIADFSSTAAALRYSVFTLPPA